MNGESGEKSGENEKNVVQSYVPFPFEKETEEQPLTPFPSSHILDLTGSIQRSYEKNQHKHYVKITFYRFVRTSSETNQFIEIQYVGVYTSYSHLVIQNKDSSICNLQVISIKIRKPSEMKF